MPRDVASRAAKERCDAGYGVNKTGEAVYLDFAAAIIVMVKNKLMSKVWMKMMQLLVKKLGQDVVRAKYGNFSRCMKKL